MKMTDNDDNDRRRTLVFQKSLPNHSLTLSLYMIRFVYTLKHTLIWLWAYQIFMPKTESVIMNVQCDI